MKYAIQNCEGYSGRRWDALYTTLLEAAYGIAAEMGWDTVVLSDSFNDVHGDGNEYTCWAAYETVEQRDADDDGSYAPRVVQVRS